MNRFAGQTVSSPGQQGHRARHRHPFCARGRNVAIAAIERTRQGRHRHRRRNRREGAGLQLDVTDPAAAIREVYGAAEATPGAISVSVQNAGVITIAKVEDLTGTHEWDLNLT